MKITLLAIGKTDQKELQSLIDLYQQRLKHYISFDLIELPDIKKGKNLSEANQKKAEGELLQKHLQNSDHVILLDEKGKSYSSLRFADLLQKKMNSGYKNLVFIIGGPYGFSEDLYQRANGKLALSAMTFSHQMVRLFFVEQLYRGFTILKNEPYHHQ
ncbi:MAG: 23S rRNA (pseudouridine(1915)-N(3))-methyltransferase RlmH [Flavobacteriales bacterium]|jgi:23S rRNA (pseudouridine1915-N3)-methyltransferase|uniref:23S rRNA (pseudouridine(1915)-N(3))-methyltransferase RlmH n=1 Tax=Candidatus Ulvibacter alkanivorans TaxID=2267620 RepID=UPI000DF1E59F|nr:23S rRNA (pseudouridine(1915)-N(3))-methyltransferase RlmH [Candidatus Ulvibacter alkanivorans]MCH2488851.1 23S rRNA (pseudouridine(1915)-N(3))-methyltransferase RlmH [Flavobacteriales bacterium]